MGIAEGIPYIDRIVCYSSSRFANKNGDRWDERFPTFLLHQLRSGQFDLVFDMESDWKFVLYCLVNPQLWRIELGRTRLYDTLRRYICKAMRRNFKWSHEVDICCNAIPYAMTSSTSTNPQLLLHQDSKSYVQSLLREWNLQRKHFVVVHPGGGRREKQWSANRYTQVISWLNQSCGLQSIVISSKAEHALADRIVLDAGTGVSIPGSLALRHVPALLEAAYFFIGNDSAPAHIIAAAVGIPVFVIFGSTEPATCVPRGNFVRVICEPINCKPCRGYC